MVTWSSTPAPYRDKCFGDQSPAGNSYFSIATAFCTSDSAALRQSHQCPHHAPEALHAAHQIAYQARTPITLFILRHLQTCGEVAAVPLSPPAFPQSYRTGFTYVTRLGRLSGGVNNGAIIISIISNGFGEFRERTLFIHPLDEHIFLKLFCFRPNSPLQNFCSSRLSCRLDQFREDVAMFSHSYGNYQQPVLQNDNGFADMDQVSPVSSYHYPEPGSRAVQRSPSPITPPSTHAFPNEKTRSTEGFHRMATDLSSCSTLNQLCEHESEAKLTDGGEVAPEYSGAKRGPSTLRWWSAELICSLVALASLLAQITVLYIYDGQAQELWPSETFTLNALIAVLATVCRTSFMFTVCSVAAQAKWNRLSSLGGGDYFPLKDYALLDEASRGVWASAQLIWRFKGR